VAAFHLTVSVVVGAACVGLMSPAKGGEAKRPVRMLWLGSSSTYYHDQPKYIGDWLTAYGKMPPILSELAGKSGTGIHVYLRPDFEAQYGLKKGQTMLDKIRDGRYGYVVLQMVTHFIAGKEGAEFEKATDTYCKAIREAGGEPVFYEMGWGSDEVEEPGRVKVFEAALRNRVGLVAPCSTAWRRVRKEHPDIELHNLPDRTHPGSLGCYLNYCCFLAAFTKAAPVGVQVREVRYWGRMTDDEKAQARQKMANGQVTDPYFASLSGWMQLNSVAAKAQQIDDAIAAYLQKVARETWQDYQRRLGDAAPGPAKGRD